MVNSLQKYRNAFLGILLVLVLAPWFTPKPNSSAFLQIDFWALWLVVMVLLALPLHYLEVALSKRSKKMPLLGLEELTRQADVKTTWRAVSWLSIVLSLFIAAGLLVAGTSNLLTMAHEFINPYAGIGLLLLAAVGLSFVGGRLILPAAVIALLAVVVSGVNISSHWQITAITSSDWVNAVLLAVTCTGVGTGLFWQLSYHKSLQSRESTMVVLPVWLAQVITGLVFAFFQGVNGSISPTIYAVAAIMAAACLFWLITDNLKYHNKSTPKTYGIAIAILLASTLIWMLVTQSTNGTALMFKAVALLSLITAGIFAVFAGWKMKISHLRKSLKFNAETTYNIWRVCMRILIPLALTTVLLLTIVSFFK